MDPIKEAFIKIKQDILSLKQDIYQIKNQIQTIQTHNIIQETQQTDNQTHNYNFNTEFTHKIKSSIGNDGVPTDRQTDQQTDKQIQNSSYNPTNKQNSHKLIINLKDPISQFKRANEVLSSLDDVKKEIRLKFKNLTPQEMLVFSTLYSMEEQKIDKITYNILSNQLKLSESSIRDYINKLIKKGIPIEKIRQNNKTILLKISKDLKNIVTLNTILQLREL